MHSKGMVALVSKQKLPANLSEWRALQKHIRCHLSDLSFRAMGSTAPNPPVAALCVVPLSKKKEVHLIGGATEPAGMRHAEIVCLDAFDRLCKENPGLYEKASLHFYVTLEPCTTYGRTPPCVKRIANYQGRISHLHYFFSDPVLRLPAKNVLRGAKIRVSQAETGVPRAQKNRKLKALQEKHGRLQKSSNLHPHRHSQASARGGDDLGFALQGFFERSTRRRPRLHIKIACTKDGIMGLREGRLRVSGKMALGFGMRLRAHTDAVLTGPGTIACDHPSLNLRIDDYGRHPLSKETECPKCPDPFLRHLLCADASEAGYIQRHLPWHEPSRLFLLGRGWPGASDFFSKQARISRTTGKEASYYALPGTEPFWKSYEKENKKFHVSVFGKNASISQENFWTEFLRHLALDYNDVLIEAGPGLLSALEPHLGAEDCIYILESKRSFLECWNEQAKAEGLFGNALAGQEAKKGDLREENIRQNPPPERVYFPKNYWIIAEKQASLDLGEDILHFYRMAT